MSFFAFLLTTPIMSFSLAEIATNYYETIDLFEKYNLDYYQNGKQTLKDACKQRGLNFSEINAELNLLKNQPKSNSFYVKMGESYISQLLYYINGEYHSREEALLSQTCSAIHEVVMEKLIGKSFIQVAENIEAISGDLKEKFTQHCNNEEETLLPYVKELLEARRSETIISPKKTLSLKTVIRRLEEEHKKTAMILCDIKKISNNFFVPIDAPQAFKTIMQGFRRFEKDFHYHLHIENNILFPKLLALEKELNSKVDI